MWDQYKNHKNTFWSVEEIDMSIDRKEGEHYPITKKLLLRIYYLFEK